MQNPVNYSKRIMNPEPVSSHPSKLFFRMMSTRIVPYSMVKLAGAQKKCDLTGQVLSMCRSFETNFVPAQELKTFKKRDNTRDNVHNKSLVSTRNDFINLISVYSRNSWRLVFMSTRSFHTVNPPLTDLNLTSNRNRSVTGLGRLEQWPETATRHHKHHARRYKRCELWRLKHRADNVALAIGQVVRAPDFSFLDALGALEIMDPKTDSGMALEDDDEKDISELQSLLPEELIWIMDQLLAREACVLFLNGGLM